MRLLSSAAAVAVLALTTPAFAAGQAAAPAPQAAPAPEPAEEADSPEEAAFEAKAEAFGQVMETMASEMQAAAAQADKTKAKADLDAIQAKYQPQVDAFAEDVQTFAVSSGQATPEQLAPAIQQIKGIPADVRGKIDAAVAAPAASAPATPQ
ncbi:hypothetical protein [Brevundimonas vesicularis]|uniref:Translation initiation factor IF-2 n=1 Tax=Brevundimonas vesicularis TaxID=41276 RepID=A0A1Z3U8U1_BREVE|nr:hypothetical protein [Brevundimonas vesicularis]ASE39709.2 translation initiation factor IF-2 [Brevundimonas vesicularis]MDX2334897.1 translation initiation factor IF-2 [Brevundimonas vesicularis]